MELVNQAVRVCFSEKLSVFRKVVAVVGAGYLATIVLRELCVLASGFRALFLSRWGLFRVDLKKYGSWAGERASAIHYTVLSSSTPPPP